MAGIGAASPLPRVPAKDRNPPDLAVAAWRRQRPLKGQKELFQQ